MKTLAKQFYQLNAFNRLSRNKKAFCYTGLKKAFCTPA